MDLYPLDSNYLPASEWIRQTIQRLGTKDDVIEFFFIKDHTSFRNLHSLVHNQFFI